MSSTKDEKQQTMFKSKSLRLRSCPREKSSIPESYAYAAVVVNSGTETEQWERFFWQFPQVCCPIDGRWNGAAWELWHGGPWCGCGGHAILPADQAWSERETTKSECWLSNEEINSRERFAWLADQSIIRSNTKCEPFWIRDALRCVKKEDWWQQSYVLNFVTFKI